MYGDDEKINASVLEVTREHLDDSFFLPLGYGDEWVVYVLDTVPLANDIEDVRQQLHEIPNVGDEAFSRTVHDLYDRLNLRMDEIRPEVVLKVSRVNVSENGVYVYSEEELRRMLEEKSTNYTLMKRYYGDYVDECIFWLADQPKELTPRSYWESTPRVRSSVTVAEDAATHNKALMCLQRFVNGTPIYDWLQEHEINQHIQKVLDCTIAMLRQEGKVVDISSFARGNIIIDETGFPHIIDATFLIDKNSERMDSLVKSLGYASYEKIKPEDLI